MSEKITYSPVTLWRDFDSEALELDVEVVESGEKDGLIYTYQYFNGEKCPDGNSRVYSLFVYKKGKKDLPAVLLLGEPDKRMDVRHAEYWANKGYAVLVFDNAGEGDDAERFTLYPKSIDYANIRRAGRHATNCYTNAKETSWYHWAINTRRAVTFLEKSEVVDVESIGLVSTSYASYIACMVAAFEKHLSVCAVVFGVCYQELDVNDSPISREQSEEAEERERWFAAIAPQSYLIHMRTPFYLCVGSNSGTSDLDKTYRSFELIPEQTPKAIWIAHKTTDDGNPIFLKNLEKWLTLRLKKQIDPELMPEVDFKVMNKKLNIIVRVPDDEAVTDVTVYFARETKKSDTRNWRELEIERVADGIYRAKVQVFDKKKSCFAYCDVRYRGGMVLSGNLIEIKPDDVKNVSADRPGKLIYNYQMGEGDFLVYDPYQKDFNNYFGDNSLEVKTGAQNLKGLAGKVFATFALNDPKYLKHEDSLLTFDVYSEKEQNLLVTCVVDYGKKQRLFSVTKKLLGVDMWQKVCVSTNELKGDVGRRPSGWGDCEVLCIKADDEILINNLLLT